MKNKLLFKLTTAFLVVIMIFTLVLSGVFLTLFRKQTIDLNRSSMEAKAQSIANTLASFENNSQSMGNGMMGMNSGKMGYGSYLRAIEDVALSEIWIVDDELNLLTNGHGMHSFNYEELPTNAERVVNSVFAGELSYGEEFSDLLKTPSLTVGAPIFVDNKVIGVVLLHSSINGINTALVQGSTTFALGALVALVLAGVVAIFLSYRITRPLIQMKTAAIELSKGNYMTQTGLVQSDEIGQLAVVLDELAKRLQLAQTERQTLDQLRDNFITNVSHELRTPVSVLRGSLELLRDKTITSADDIDSYYEQMLLESCHLERLVNDLLELTKLQDSGFKLEMSEVNLCHILKDAARAIHQKATAKHIEIEVIHPDSDCISEGDYGRLRQLLIILLDNAVKFSADGCKITLALVKSNDYSISVTDNGIGIPSYMIDTIFERFHKSEVAINKNGTGLGLPIAKEIATRHHARISVISSSKQTTFTIHGLEIIQFNEV